MKFLIVVVFLFTCALAAAHDHPEHDHHNAHPKYEFKYGVKDLKTGDIKGQWEQRDVDHVKGSYAVKEADGTTRVVDYHADGHTGFHADVTKIGGWAGDYYHHPHGYAHGYVNALGYAHGYEQGHGDAHDHATSYVNIKRH